MRKGFLFGGLAALAVAMALVGAATLANAQVTLQPAQGYAGQPMGPWMMGPGMMGCPPNAVGWGTMGPGMMGPGMMMPGMMMGWGWGQNTAAPANLNLSANDVKGFLQQWLVMTRNPRLKVGAVTEKDADTITADIVTTDKDALVQRFSVNRHTGSYSSVQ
jgi:hypothetical protein